MFAKASLFMAPLMVVTLAVGGGAATAQDVSPIELSVVGTYQTGIFEESASEIVAHDPVNQRLFVVNAQAPAVDVLDISDPTAPVLAFSLDLSGIPSQDGSVTLEGGIANSVAIRRNLVAVAIEHPIKTEPGWVGFFDLDGNAISAVRVGSLPDMVTFTPNGRTLLVANEGEPEPNLDSPGFSADPEGSVSLVDIPGNISRLRQSNVRTATFHAWDDGEEELDPAVRIFGPTLDPNRRISQNLEPEYITVDTSSRTAYVILQEANAMAVLDIKAGEFIDIVPFGFKDHLLAGNEFDASDEDGPEEEGDINLQNWPVWGMYQPDGAATYRWRNQTLIVTANEGDTRDWPGDEDFDDSGYSEESRFRGFTDDDQDVCPGSRLAQWLSDDQKDLEISTLKDLRENFNLGRLTITTTLGVDEETGCIGDVYVFGGRSFSIWTTDGEQVYDSGSDFERITADTYPDNFNSDHTENNFDNRSDNKGPEPEGIELGTIDGRTYAFIGLERIGGIMVYDITNPTDVTFVQYINNRDFTVDTTLESGATNPAVGDLGAEGIKFIPADDSPIPGVPMLAVANEVSGTTTLFRIDQP